MKIQSILAASLMIAASASAQAGGPDNISGFSTGIYVGAGAGLSSIKANYKDLDLEGAFPHIQASSLDIVPVFQVGYWGNLGASSLWGVKLFYKYLGSSTNYYMTSDPYIDLDAQINHQLALLFFYGFPMRNFLGYIGVGPLLMPAKSVVFTGPDADSVTSKNLWGALFQAGVDYNINANWFADAGFSYGVTGNGNFSKPINDALYNRKLSISTAELTLTVNRRFNF